MHYKKISIVIPVYNSEENLLKLYAVVDDALKDMPYEIIMVNDQSKDNSWDIIQLLTKKSSRVIGVNLRKNSGQDNAIFAGLHYANGDYIVIMDDDLQHSPYDIPRLYEAIEQGHDVCYANFKTKKQAIWKNIGSWFNGKISEIIINKPKNIYLSPYKIIKKDVIVEILKYRYLYPYIDGMIFTLTNDIIQIDAEHFDRYSGNSNYNFIKSISVFMKLATSFSVVPLRVSSFLGVFSSLLGFTLAIYFILEYLFNNHIVEGWTSLMVMTLFIGGLILFSLGVIGEYLGRAYLNLNNKPPYTIKEVINGQ